jgi:aspartate-semialdehyde dehydrogenase
MAMKKKPAVAIVGATGLVGREMLHCLEQRNFPLESLRLFASGRSAGEKIEFRGKQIVVENLATASFSKDDIVLASAGAKVSEMFAPKAVSEGAVVIDNSSAFRMSPDVPLVVPEVNREKAFEHKGIIANPNCSTIQLVVVLWPIHKAFGLKRVIVSTYQAVSGAGKRAMDELVSQCVSILNHRPVKIEKLPHQIAFNLLPHIDVFEENGYTKEEMKMIRETRKITGLHNLCITATCVRVPVLNGHSESVVLDLEKDATPEDIKSVLDGASGVKVVDDPRENEYPMPLLASGKDDVLVGRIRKDTSADKSVSLWIAADNLRKGAGLNAVQIAEVLLEQ